MRTSLHRRIVAAYHLDTLGSADSLLWAVSLRKNSYQLFLACYDFAIDTHVVIEHMTVNHDVIKYRVRRTCFVILKKDLIV